VQRRGRLVDRAKRFARTENQGGQGEKGVGAHRIVVRSSLKRPSANNLPGLNGEKKGGAGVSEKSGRKGGSSDGRAKALTDLSRIKEWS